MAPGGLGAVLHPVSPDDHHRRRPHRQRDGCCPPPRGSYALTNTTYVYDGSAKRLLLLTALTEKGRDGGARPAWSFSHVQPKGSSWFNHTLLAAADNGQGGKATYTYEDSGNIYIGLCRRTRCAIARGS